MSGQHPPLADGAEFAGRYKILGLLGQGGMGHVYKAEHTGLKKLVALKVIRAAFIGEPEMRFAREAATLSKLDHRGCVRILDYGRSGKYLFLAMELIEGRNLAQVIEQDGPLSVERATKIAAEILTALGHAHDHGILHRDVKPENVMVGEDRVVVIDFGLARALGDSALTANGMCYGSPSYLAPERLAGQPYDERADVYAVGVILYEMLSRERPHPGSDMYQVMNHVLQEAPVPLRKHRQDLPRWVESVVMKAMARDPEKRFEDAMGMRDSLRVTEDESASTVFHLAARKSLLKRMWSRLRYGAWRWEHSGAH